MTAFLFNFSFTGKEAPDFAIKTKQFEKWIKQCPLEIYRFYIEKLKPTGEKELISYTDLFTETKK